MTHGEDTGGRQAAMRESPSASAEINAPSTGAGGGNAIVSILLVTVIVSVLGLMAMLWIQKTREAARRTVCMNNLKQIGSALVDYETEYGGPVPLVNALGEMVPAVDNNNRLATALPARSAFAVLLKKRYITTTKVFICPSTRDTAAETDPSYPSDFENADLAALVFDDNQCSYGWDPTRRPACLTYAIVADKPPMGVRAANEGTTRNNSENHGKEGQNVYYSYGEVKWGDTPAGDGGDDPDIYTGGSKYWRDFYDAKIIR